MTIRKASVSDAQAVFDLRIRAIRVLCKGFYPEPLLLAWTDGTAPSDAFKDFVERLVHVLEVDGSIVACGAIATTNQIDAVFVEPAQAGAGLGGRIVRHLMQLAEADNPDQPLRLDATLNAAAFYRRFGFVGDAVSQYHSPRGFSLDCIPMVRAMARVATPPVKSQLGRLPHSASDAPAGTSPLRNASR